jgi:hypothetical protein
MADPATVALVLAAAGMAASKPGRAATKTAVTSGYRATGWRTPPKALVHHSGRAGAVGGRLVGKTSRTVGRASRTTARSAAAVAERRWNTRQLDPVPLLWRHRDTSPPVTAGPTRSSRPAQPKAPTTSAPGGPTPGSQSEGPVSPPPAPQGEERSPITMPSRRYAINLETPSSDAEFLESCIEVGDVLRSLASEIEEWAEGLKGLALPTSVTHPLEAIAEGIDQAASGTAQAASAFADEFEDAREVASRGMKITGQDAA